MKKLVLVFLVLILCGCTNIVNRREELGEKELQAYKLVLEICYKADDPSKVRVISGTAHEDLGVFKVSYNNNQTYVVLVSCEYNKCKAEELHNSLVSEYSDLIYSTTSFDVAKVNRALNNKWQN